MKNKMKYGSNGQISGCPEYDYLKGQRYSPNKSKEQGFEFKWNESYGYVYHFDHTERLGDEYIMKIPIGTFLRLMDYYKEEGDTAIQDYIDWEYKDGGWIWY